MQGLVIYNTRTRKKELLTSIEPGHLRIYTCGPTVYAPQHLGNLRSQLFADLLKRACLAEGFRVTHVINITDVGHLTDDADAGEDKMEAAAKRSGRRAEEIAAQYTEQWLQDRARVGCLAPEILCKATEHIAEQIELAQRLEERGYTYRLADGIYFDTAKFTRYAEFARLDLEAQAPGARIGKVEGKRNAADFALWKFAEPDSKRQQEWDSPWGRGFPGWHLECSAMSAKYLGTKFDIHTGGIDHIAVHHTNEIAQSECGYDAHPSANFWMHNEFLSFGKDEDIHEKMSKSKGNVLLLDDLTTQGIAPLAFRYFFLQAHYRQQQACSQEALMAADTGYRRLLAQAIKVRASVGDCNAAHLAPFRARFREAIRDDLNAPRALAVAWDVVHDSTLSSVERKTLLCEFDCVLGLDLATAVLEEKPQEHNPRIDELVQAREAARKAKNWAEADRIRDALLRDGIEIVDTPEGPRWKRQ